MARAQRPTDLSPLLHRAAELKKLTAFVAPIFSTRPRMPGTLRLLGAAGVGKSRLLEELHSILVRRKRPPHWIALRCDSGNRAGWTPLANWLRDYAGMAAGMDDAARRAALEAAYETLARKRNVPAAARAELRRTMPFAADLLDCRPASCDSTEPLDPATRHENRVLAFKELVLALSHTAPVVVVIENAQWLDSATAAWLTALTRNVADRRLAILVASRPADDGSRPDLHISADTTLRDIELRPIPGTGFVHELAQALFGATLSDAAAALVADHAAGNPLHARHLLLFLRESGALTGRTALKLAGQPELPRTLPELISLRVDALEPDLRQAVRYAAILSSPFSPRVLVDVLCRAGLSVPRAEHALTECARLGLIAPTP